LLREYPEGQVLSWRFKIEDKVIHHFGSAGSTSEELDRLGRQPTDILLVPLQGHTNIVEIALKYVKALLPKVVIPHHQDNFYPPISTMVNLQPFVEGVPKLAPATEVRVLEMNQTVTL
jgi:L-ascorbate metabolism protein UlaG (beta-lactamase superfamily)